MSSPDDTMVDAPTDEVREALLATFTAELGDAVVGSHIRPGDDLWVRVTTEAWRAAGEVARHKLGHTYFTFLSGIDWMTSPYGRSEDSPVDEPSEKTPAPTASGYAGGDTRFQVFARVARPHSALGITLKADLDDEDPRVDTWIPVYAGANWHEREAWEMYGFTFVGHPNLTHIYLPGAFEGTPLRKDFPLLARQVKPWPGIVDVEPMPDSGDEEGEGEGDAEATEGAS